MKVNYIRLEELNRLALVDNERSQLSSFFVIQMGIEKFLDGEELTQEHKNLLIEVGVLEQTEEDIARETIVGPFNFSQHGPTNS